MSGMPNRRALLLDLAAAIGWAGPALMVLYSLETRAIWASIAVVSLLVASMIVWVLWRRSGQRSRVAAISFAVIAVITMSLGNGALYYVIVSAACLVLGVTFASAAVVWGYAASLVGIVIALHLSSGSAPHILFSEAAVAAIFVGIAATVAAILRDSFRVGEELRAALARLDAANAELRGRLDTDRDLVLARERERTARELHDGLGHRLTAIGLSLDYATRVGDSPEAREETRRARDLVGESLDAMRRLVRAMHPVELSTLRNAEAFRAVADAFRGTGIDIRVSIEGDDSALTHERALLLLSFVQEGLTNVVRHSDAASVDLRMVVGDADLSAVIEDRGAGASTGPFVEGFGLRSLRARAEQIGGMLDAAPTSQGFRVALAVPARVGAETIVEFA